VIDEWSGCLDGENGRGFYLLAMALYYRAQGVQAVSRFSRSLERQLAAQAAPWLALLAHVPRETWFVGEYGASLIRMDLVSARPYPFLTGDGRASGAELWAQKLITFA